MRNFIQRIKASKKLQIILFSGLLVQLIFSVVSVGFFHPDQHFQIIEFSSYQLREANAATSVWELENNIRPTLQVYCFSLFRSACQALSIYNPFYQLTLLRVLLGVIFLAVFNLIAFYFCEKKSDRTLTITLLLLNFSWFLPYSRTLFSSEIVAALALFPAMVFFHQRYNTNKATLLNSLVTGFLLAIAFFLRFQVAFAIVGFFIWILLFEKQVKLTFYLLIGFALSVALNVFLDYNFYQKLVFTPYLYFKVNILEGKAASFGEKNFTYYIGVLAGIFAAPLLSLVLLYHYLKTSIQQIRHPLVLSSLLFILGHFLVGHKEDRFMFTILNILPIVLAIHSSPFYYFSQEYKWKKILKPVIVFSVVLNFLLLILFIFNPYSQTVNFATVLSDKFAPGQTRINYYQRNPLETESHLPLTFYKNGLKNIEFAGVNNLDSVMQSASKPAWLAVTFNDIKAKFETLDSLGYKPQAYSSAMLWNINLLMHSKKMKTINDIWVLYKLEK